MTKRNVKILSFLVASLGLCFILVGAFEELTTRDDYSYNRWYQVRMREKIFTKGRSEIRLIGMIHVAEIDFYESIRNNLPKEKTDVVTLMEGVGSSKTNEITYLDYQEVSKEVGLAAQTNYLSMFPNMVRADIPHDELSSKLKENITTVDLFIGLLLKLHRNEISLQGVQAKIAEHEQSFRELRSFLATVQVAEGEIIAKRNDALWKQIEKYQKTKNLILVPWGSAHLADIENRLIGDGYSVQKQRSYGAINLIPTLVRNWGLFQTYIQLESLMPE